MHLKQICIKQINKSLDLCNVIGWLLSPTHICGYLCSPVPVKSVNFCVIPLSLSLKNYVLKLHCVYDVAYFRRGAIIFTRFLLNLKLFPNKIKYFINLFLLRTFRVRFKKKTKYKSFFYQTFRICRASTKLFCVMHILC